MIKSFKCIKVRSASGIPCLKNQCTCCHSLQHLPQLRQKKMRLSLRFLVSWILLKLATSQKLLFIVSFTIGALFAVMVHFYQVIKKLIILLNSKLLNVCLILFQGFQISCQKSLAWITLFIHYMFSKFLLISPWSDSTSSNFAQNGSPPTNKLYYSTITLPVPTSV